MLKLLILKKHFPEKLPKLDVEETAIWRDHQSAACLMHLWMSLDNSIMCQAAKLSNHPLLEISVLCPLTKYWEFPLADDVKKQLTVAFVVFENCSLLTLLSITHWQICWCSLADENSHWLLHWCCQDFQSDNHCQFHWHFPPLSAERRDNLSLDFWILNSPPSGVGVFHWCTPPINCTRVPSSFLLLAAICLSEFDFKTYTILWPWMTIPRDQSMNNRSSISLIFVVCSIMMMNDLTCHNGD